MAGKTGEHRRQWPTTSIRRPHRSSCDWLRFERTLPLQVCVVLLRWRFSGWDDRLPNRRVFALATVTGSAASRVGTGMGSRRERIVEMLHASGRMVGIRWMGNPRACLFQSCTPRVNRMWGWIVAMPCFPGRHARYVTSSSCCGTTASRDEPVIV